MVKFGRPEASWKTREENSLPVEGYGRSRIVVEAEVREKRERRRGNKRSSTRRLRVDGIFQEKEQEEDKRQRNEH